MDDKEPVEMNEEELAAVIGGTNGGMSAELTAALASGDIESVIQMVQAERVRLLDAQMIDQVGQVQQRNENIARMNDVLSGLNGAAQNDNPGISLSDTMEPGRTDGPTWGEVLDGFGVTGTDTDGNGTLDKGEIDNTIAHLKGAIDAESNNQQMDMLRLQSLNNKRNESVDIMTQMRRSGSDPASSIVRNI